jgi:hypothetical protein
MSTIQHLHLERIHTNPQLMRLLPSEIAFHYHALPVAADGDRITVAIAHPEDTTATEVVTAIIGLKTCFVHADQREIDDCLSEIWVQNPESQLRFLAWTPTTDIDPKLPRYSQGLAELLQADLKELGFYWSDQKSFDAFVREAESILPDLIIFHIPTPPMMNRLLVDFAVNKLIDSLNASILVVKNPRWPLQKILLAIRDSEIPDDSSIDWVIRLAHRSHAAVTVLPLIPPVPQMYGSFIRYTVSSLLASSDPLGEKMRWIAQRLTTEEVGGAFRIREGPPLEQLHSEVLDSDTDLVAIKAEPQNHLWRWLVGEVVNNLFVWLDRPLLITK